MDQSWTDEYAEEVRKQTEKIQDITEQSYGYRPEVEVEIRPLVEVHYKFTRPDGTWVSGGTQQVTETSIKASHKPNLMARRIGRSLEYTSTVNANGQYTHASLRAKEQYLLCKQRARQHHYGRFTQEQLETPPTALEKLLHPGIARRVTRLIAETESMQAPTPYVYNTTWRVRTVNEPVFDATVEDIVRD